MSRGLVCAAIAWAHTHPAEGVMRRLVDASRVRFPVPVRSQPRWSRRIPTRITHGIGHDHAWVFMDSIGNKAVNPKLAESAPNSCISPHTRGTPERPAPSAGDHPVAQDGANCRSCDAASRSRAQPSRLSSFVALPISREQPTGNPRRYAARDQEERQQKFGRWLQPACFA